MSHQQLAPNALESWAQIEPGLPVLNCSYHSALDQLGRVFSGALPLAILVGEGKIGASYLIDRFLAGVEGEIDVVRITEPCLDEVSGMRAIIHGIGFEPKDLNLTDLENVFTLFLSFQRTHHRRTILCLEEAQESGWWVVEKIRGLVELETDEKFGLMILMSGQPSLHKLLNRSILDAVCTHAEQRVALGAFTLAETREYIKCRIESTGTADIAQAFEFHAITLIHELSKGMADVVNSLYTRCRQLANEERTAPVTTDLVHKADVLLQTSSTQPSDADITLVNFAGVRLEKEQLIVRINDEVVQEHSLVRGHILIGRGELCDIRIPSPPVSRHHALVINAADGVTIVDLESTNGTVVDGHQIRQQRLADRGVIEIGDCCIEYVAGDDGRAWGFDIERDESVEPYHARFATQKLRTCHDEDAEEGGAQHAAPSASRIKGNINSKGEKIFHVHGSWSYGATKIDEAKGDRWFRSEEEAEAAGWRAARSR